MKLCLLPFSNTTFPVWERKANSEFSIRHLDWEQGIPEICRCQAEVNLCLTRCKQGAPLSGRSDTCLHWQPILRLVAPNWHSRGVDKMVNRVYILLSKRDCQSKSSSNLITMFTSTPVWILNQDSAYVKSLGVFTCHNHFLNDMIIVYFKLLFLTQGHLTLLTFPNLLRETQKG